MYWPTLRELLKFGKKQSEIIFKVGFQLLRTPTRVQILLKEQAINVMRCLSEIQVIAPSGFNTVMLQNANVVISGLNYKGGLGRYST